MPPILTQSITDSISEFSRLESILTILDSVPDTVASPWAVLLVCFRDDPEQLPALDEYEDLFTATGTGRMNMVDYFSDMSHRKVDLSGSRVFGWFRLPANRADYVGNVYPQPPGKLNRDGLLSLAWQVAGAAGDTQVNFPDFAGTVVCSYGGTDLCGWVGGMAALCDSNSLSPSLLGQEMGHGYGLDHARADGSEADYQDPWDVMSTMAWPNMQADSATWGPQTIGPGLNAWCMRSRSWLDETRVWKNTSTVGTTATVELRPLHRHDLPGLVAAEIGQYLVEFRVPELWDAAIPQACVLVHRFANNHSYLMANADGVQALTEGTRFDMGSPVGPHYGVEVLSIDEHNHKAKLRITFLPAYKPPGLVGPAIGAVEAGADRSIIVVGGRPSAGEPGGERGIIVVGGRPYTVDAVGPMADLLSHLATYLSHDSGADVAAARRLRRAALGNVVESAIALHAQEERVSEPPPGYSTGFGPG